jgi:hypothetical protein
MNAEELRQLIRRLEDAADTVRGEHDPMETLDADAFARDLATAADLLRATLPPKPTPAPKASTP